MQRQMPKPKERWLRVFLQSMMNSSDWSIMHPSRLPEAYHMTTLSLFLVAWPFTSTFWGAIWRTQVSGVCQRMIS